MRYIALVSAIYISLFSSFSCYAGEKPLTIGTAEKLGVYYPTGGAVCRLLKRGIKEHGIDCEVKLTSGSTYNLKSIAKGRLDLAIAQSDSIYYAKKGKNEFVGYGKNDNLRSIFSLHTEAFTVLVRSDSDINSIRNLKGKNIGIGDDGSGMKNTAWQVIKAEGWNKDSFADIIEAKPSELGKELCSGNVDAILFTTGHPNASTQKINNLCPNRMISVEGKEIDKLLADNPYYDKFIIPAGLYKGSKEAVNTFGLKATLVTSEDISDEYVYQIVKAVFDNLDDFKTLHPVFATLDKNQMVSQGLVVPLHNGAIKYYKEVGLLK